MCCVSTCSRIKIHVLFETRRVDYSSISQLGLSLTRFRALGAGRVWSSTMRSKCASPRGMRGRHLLLQRGRRVLARLMYIEPHQTRLPAPRPPPPIKWEPPFCMRTPFAWPSSLLARSNVDLVARFAKKLFEPNSSSVFLLKLYSAPSFHVYNTAVS